MDCNAKFEGAFQHRFVEVGAVGVPIRISVLFDTVGDEVYFREDIAVFVSAEDEALGIDAVLFEFWTDAPSL